MIGHLNQVIRGMVASALVLAVAGGVFAQDLSGRQVRQLSNREPLDLQPGRAMVIQETLDPHGDLLDELGAFEAYVVDLREGDALQCRVWSNSFEPTLTVVGPDGRQQQVVGEEPIDIAAERAGRYLVLVSSAEMFRGAFRLRLARPSEAAGRLREGDSQLNSGEFYDVRRIAAQEGDTLVLEMSSDEFDTYLGVVGPTGEVWENDDADDFDGSRLEIDIEAAGDYQVIATSYAPGETGRYRLRTLVERGRMRGIHEVHRGSLQTSDERRNGKYCDPYVIRGVAGQTLLVDMRGDGWDTYLEVRRVGGGEIASNDDFGSVDHSRIQIALPETGEYEIVATSLGGGVTGSYELEIDLAAPSEDRLLEVGDLAEGDERLDTGEYVDRFRFQGEPGRRMRVMMTSTELSPYLIVRTPGGDQFYNEGSRGAVASVDIPVAEEGEYEVLATSSARRETGAYTVIIETVPEAQNADDHGGRSERGSLSSNDQRLPSGEYYDSFHFTGQAGQRVRIAMESPNFDTYLILSMPSGRQEENDDDGNGTGSAIDLVLEEDGQYEIIATSYSAGSTGNYTVSIEMSEVSEYDTTARTERGTLGEGDQRRKRGQYYDRYVVEAREGEMVDVTLESSSFDSYLLVVCPDGQILENDDGGGSLNSRIELTVENEGEYVILASTLSSGAAGPYTLTINSRVPLDNLLVRRFSGRLSDGDRTLDTGEFVDRYPLLGRAGQRVQIELGSEEFDTYLILAGPAGGQQDNDDVSDTSTDSALDVVLEEDGEYEVLVTSYDSGETGEYELVIVTEAEQGPGGEKLNRGSLEEGDLTLRSGEFYDSYSIQGRAGQRLNLAADSDEFDTYLILVSPSGEQEENDDAEGHGTNSRLSARLAETGEYRVLVTSYGPNETGAYELAIETEDADETETAANRPIRGRLQQGDLQRDGGKFYDSYTFLGEQGQTVTIDLTSGELDTYLYLRTPSGREQSNDDGGEGANSRMSLTLEETGEYVVMASSFSSGQTGAYELTIDIAGGQASRTDQNLTTLPIDQRISGELDEEDITLEGTGEYVDGYAFTGRAGQTIRLDMQSDEFDPYLLLLDETGTKLAENDDFDGSIEHSRVEVTLRETGTYIVAATSYAPGEIGKYHLTLTLPDGDDGAATPQADGARRVFGIFVGISEYEVRPLAYCSQDAVRLRDAMVNVGLDVDDAILLQDEDATVEAVEDAFAQVARQADEDDLVVFFFSGHGGRTEAPAPEAAEPDSQDEFIVMIDGIISDNRMSELFGEIPACTKLLVLDSCFAGGFAKDVITEPGRMGMFSSHEDVPSQVATKFLAGGYLAVFFRDALEVGETGDLLCDADTDGEVTALELTQYIYERYRTHVKVEDFKDDSGDDYVHTERDLSYQQFVHDRGGVGPYETLFRAAGGD